MLLSDPLQALQAPPTFTATADSILQDVDHIVETYHKEYSQVVAAVTPSKADFGNTSFPLTHAENERTLGERELIFDSNVSPDREIRTASQQARSIFDRFDAETSLKYDLFALVDAVVTSRI